MLDWVINQWCSLYTEPFTRWPPTTGIETRRAITVTTCAKLVVVVVLLLLLVFLFCAPLGGNAKNAMTAHTQYYSAENRDKDSECYL